MIPENIHFASLKYLEISGVPGQESVICETRSGPLPVFCLLVVFVVVVFGMVKYTFNKKCILVFHLYKNSNSFCE